MGQATEKEFAYIDLFSGCGGISLGLRSSGWTGLFAVEKNSNAFATLKHNLIDNNSHFVWPEWLEKKNWNINTLLSQKRTELEQLQGSVDLVVGGPPCQGFSTAGERKALDKRNLLIHKYLEFVELVQPKVVMFENVSGFTYKFLSSRKHKEKPYSDLALEKLVELGYSDAQGEMMDFQHFGIPQSRRRYLVIASRINISGRIFEVLKQGRAEFLRTKSLEANQTLYDAISDLEFCHGTVDCPDTKGFKSGIAPSAKSNLQKMLRLSEAEYTPDSHRFVNHRKKTRAAFIRIQTRSKAGLTIRGENRKKLGVKKRSVTLLDRNKPSQTITTIPDDFIHYSEPRVMTVRECARIQTFPDWFEFKGPYTSGGQLRKNEAPRYTQVGNAVPPLFAEQVGEAIKQVLANAS